MSAIYTFLAPVSGERCCVWLYTCSKESTRVPKLSEATTLEDSTSNSTLIKSDNRRYEHDLQEFGGGKAQYNPHWTNICGTEITITVSNLTGVVWALDPRLSEGRD